MAGSIALKSIPHNVVLSAGFERANNETSNDKLLAPKGQNVVVGFLFTKFGFDDLKFAFEFLNVANEITLACV